MRFGFAAALLGLGVAAAFVLAACAPVSQHPQPTATARSTPSATPGPTSSRPALSQIVVSPNGLGDLVVGAAISAGSPATAIMTYDPTKCVAASEGIAPGAPGAGAWLPAYPNSLTYAGSGLPFDVGPVSAQSDAIRQIEVWSPQLKTSKGVGVGSTAAQITAAYGSALTVDRAENSDVLVLRGSRSELLFEVAKAAAGLPIEETGTVVWMRIVPLGTTQLHIANTDASGPCSF